MQNKMWNGVLELMNNWFVEKREIESVSVALSNEVSGSFGGLQGLCYLFLAQFQCFNL